MPCGPAGRSNDSPDWGGPGMSISHADRARANQAPWVRREDGTLGPQSMAQPTEGGAQVADNFEASPEASGGAAEEPNSLPSFA